MRERFDFTGETKLKISTGFLGHSAMLRCINVPRMLPRLAPARRTPRILPGALLLALFFGPPSRADEIPPPEKPSRAEVRASLARESSFSRKSEVGVSRGGEAVELKADLFRPENQDGTGELKATNTPAAEFRWNVRCSPRALTEGCADAELAAEGEAFRYKTPDQLKDGLVEITVTHASDPQAKDAFVTLRVQAERERRNLTPGPGRGAAGPQPTRAAPEPTRRRPRDDDDEDKSTRRGGRGGKSSFGPSIRSRADDDGGGSSAGGKKSKSRKFDRGAEERSFGDSWDMGFGGGGFGGRSSSPRTSARGYNRDNSATVVSCSSLPRPGGGSEVRCEQPRLRELRVRTRQQSPAERKAAPPVKRALAPAARPPAPRPSPPAKAQVRKAPAPPAPARSAARTPSVSAAPTSQKGR